MKKNRFNGPGVPIGLPAKMFLTMRLTVVLTLLLNVSVLAAGFSQENRVSLDMENVSLEEVILELRQQTGFRFFYSMDKIRAVDHLTVKVKDWVLRDVLDELLRNTNLTYSLLDEVIVIKDRNTLPALDSLKQTIIRGVVKDKNGVTLPGVSVIMKGTKLGVSTDVNGEFALSTTEKDSLTLVFSYVGMKTREVRVNLQKNPRLNVVLEEDVAAMEEVVVTGYMNLKKSSFTGNATTVNRDQLLKTNNKNLIAALQTFDPSFRIKENSLWGSDPNALPEFNIRGESSIGLNKSLEVENMKQTQRTNLMDNPNLPIFILDGFEVSVQKIYDMDMNRIESITILKDAAATAMYGSRAANGVVVVESVAPKPGEMHVMYNLSGSLQFPDLSDYNLCNAAEKLEAERLSGVYSSTDENVLILTDKEYVDVLQRIQRGIDTDWLSQPLRNVFNHTHSVYIDGGVESIRYGLDFNYDSNKGTMKGSFRSRTGVGLSLDYRYKKLQIRNSVSYNATRSEDSPYGNFSDYTKMQPYAEMRDEDGNVLKEVRGSTTWKVINPLYRALMLDSYTGRARVDEITENLSVNYYILEGLQFKGQFSILRTDTKTESFKDPKDPDYERLANNLEKGSLSKSGNNSYNWNVNAMLYYSRGFGKHFINATGGVNVTESRTVSDATTYVGFALGSAHSSALAAQQPDKTSSTYSKNRLFGIIGSLNYSFNDVYLLDASFRLDGSSQFGKNDRFAPFWSVGVGLNIHNYSWLKDNWLVSTLRVRGSYGSTGKVNFPSYAAVTTYETQSDGWYYTGPASNLVYLGNPDLTWETTNTLDVGLEFGFLNELIHVSASYYHKETVDLIDEVAIRTSSGFKTYRSNSGSVVNKGFEINLNSTVFRDRNWVVTVNANMASNTNKIKKLGAASAAYNKALNDNYNLRLEDLNSNNASSYYFSLVTKPVQKYYEGASTTAIYAVRSAGIDPANGKEKFIRKDGTSTYTWNADDQVVVGDNSPDVQGSFGINLSFKGIYVNASFMYQWGGQAYNSTLIDKVENAEIGNANVDKRVLSQRWKQPGDVAPYRDLKSRTTIKPTDRFVQDYNYVAFGGLSVGYDFKQQFVRKMYLTSLGLRFNANDICRWSSVKEERGLNYPYARNFSFTVSVGF